ncbi:MAG: hypothetical protein A2289_26925 [Deltaproteobacteria bacterium RIFOXYA12_FULL_58_15]|nr:MAG: hypothetical protein A2289_26925 [Deltaproteobacteria bacterium RIFOXYA12_FULL_58_15]
MTYGYEKNLADISLNDARKRVVEALAAEGFGVRTEIDMKATLKKKLDVDFRPYVILGACNPKLAHRALEAEPQIGLLLPCNVVLQEGRDGVVLSIANARTMFGLVENSALDSLVNEADERLRRVLESVS